MIRHLPMWTRGEAVAVQRSPAVELRAGQSFSVCLAPCDCEFRAGSGGQLETELEEV